MVYVKFYLKMLLFIFVLTFVGMAVFMNLLGVIIKWDLYSFNEAKEVTKYIFFMSSVISPLLLLSMVITRKVRLNKVYKSK